MLFLAFIYFGVLVSCMMALKEKNMEGASYTSAVTLNATANIAYLFLQSNPASNAMIVATIAFNGIMLLLSLIFNHKAWIIIYLITSLLSLLFCLASLGVQG